MTKKAKIIPFEEAFNKLETIVSKLESGELTLEENIQLFEEGIALTKGCQNQLQTAEEKIKTLVKNSTGEFELEDLE